MKSIFQNYAYANILQNIDAYKQIHKNDEKYKNIITYNLFRTKIHCRAFVLFDYFFPTFLTNVRYALSHFISARVM